MPSITELIHGMMDGEQRKQKEAQRAALEKAEKNKKELAELEQKSVLLRKSLEQSGASALLEELNKNFLNGKGEIVNGNAVSWCTHPEDEGPGDPPTERIVKDHPHPQAWTGLFSADDKVFIFIGLGQTVDSGFSYHIGYKDWKWTVAPEPGEFCYNDQVRFGSPEEIDFKSESIARELAEKFYHLAKKYKR